MLSALIHSHRMERRLILSTVWLSAGCGNVSRCVPRFREIPSASVCLGYLHVSDMFVMSLSAAYFSFNVICPGNIKPSNHNKLLNDNPSQACQPQAEPTTPVSGMPTCSHFYSPFVNITYYGFQTVCKCPFRALLVTSATDSNQTWANLV